MHYFSLIGVVNMIALFLIWSRKNRSLNSLLFRKVLNLCTKCKPLLNSYYRKVRYAQMDLINMNT